MTKESIKVVTDRRDQYRRQVRLKRERTWLQCDSLRRLAQLREAFADRARTLLTERFSVSADRLTPCAHPREPCCPSRQSACWSSVGMPMRSRLRTISSNGSASNSRPNSAWPKNIANDSTWRNASGRARSLRRYKITKSHMCGASPPAVLPPAK